MANPSELLNVSAMPVGQTLLDTLILRMDTQPVLGWCFLLFWIAILHTFFAPAVRSFSSKVAQKRHFLGRALELFGEVEFIFILWAIPLFFLLCFHMGFNHTIKYLGDGISYREPLFVVVIIALAATRPILYLAERILGVFAKLLGGGVGGWWLSLLIIGPLLGSFITEAAAITITALLLAQKFYEAKPTKKLAYMTLALLFVNISIGGILTHFAAPAVVMVADKWQLNTPYMFWTFGVRVILAIVLNVGLMAFLFRKELRRMKMPERAEASKKVPWWIVTVHVLLLLWTVINAHYPPLLTFGLLAALWFETITREYQEPVRLFDALKVGVFLAGLVIFCGLQGWWIQPILQSLDEKAFFWIATLLASFNDNAAVTSLAAQVPNLTEGMKYAALAGAVAGGGLTIIANAPNPAGFALVRKYFRGEVVNAAGLFLAALVPTLIVAAIFIL